MSNSAAYALVQKYRDSIETRLWPKVNKAGPIHPKLGTPCWLWLASENFAGYGQLTIGSKLDNTKRPERVHRITWMLKNGAIPEGLQLDHLCRTRLCANPGHTEPVTQAVNKARGECGKRNRIKTHCPVGHPYDETNTHRTRRKNGAWARRCHACLRVQWTANNRANGYKPRT